jgi:hypothetical protein
MNTDASPIQGLAADKIGQHRRLTPRTIGMRIAALACAAVATILTLGSQLGIVASYSGELDMALAALRAQPQVVQVAASGPVAPQAGVDAPAARRQVAIMMPITR